MVIRAMKNIVARFPKTALVIVGDGSLRASFENYASTLGLSSNVIFEGWQNNVSSYYRSADVFVCNSNYEGYGVSLVEAAKNDCPIVTTDVGLVGDLLDHEAVSIIGHGDSKALVDSIERIIKMPKIGELLAKNAKNQVGSLPSKEEYLAMYKESWEKCGSC